MMTTPVARVVIRARGQMIDGIVPPVARLAIADTQEEGEQADKAS
jgi:hypothetical protein